MVTRTTEIPEPTTVTRTTQLPDPHAGVNPNQYDKPAGPEQRHVDPEQYPTPSSPNAADWDAQQRKAARHEEFETQRRVERIRREMAEKEKAEASEKASKNAKFEREQADWNVKQKLKQKTEEYEEEQKELQKQKRLKPSGEVVKEKARDVWGSIKKNLGKPVKRADEIRERNLAKQERKTEGLTKAEVEKMMKEREKKNKMGRGQFHAPGAGGKYSSSFIDPFPSGGGGKGMGFPNVDPLGGLSGGGRNMANLGLGTAPRRTARPPLQIFPSPAPQRAPPRPRPTRGPPPKMFGDPFAGLTSGPAPSPKIVGNKYGLGSGGKSSKKLKNIRDWMKF